VQEPPVVVNPPIIEQPPVVIEEPPVQEPPVVVNPPIVDQPPVVIEQPPVQEPPVVVNPPIVDQPPVVIEQPPVQEPPVVVNPPIIEQPPVVIEQPPVQEPPVVVNPPIVDQPPVVIEQPPVQEPPVVVNPPIVTPPPVVLPPIVNPPVDSCVPVAQNMCGSKSHLAQCGDDGMDSSTDQDDANECLAFRGLNLSAGIHSRHMPRIRENHKNVWLTDSAITEPIRGHGKLVIMFTGKKGKGSIFKIDGWKGKIILCGFVVDQIKQIRGKIALVNSEVKKFEYSRGRLVSHRTELMNNKIKISSASLSGGLLNPGVFSINANKITSLGDWTKMSSESVKAKMDFSEQKEQAIREHELTLKDINNQILTLQKRGKEKYHREIEIHHARAQEIRLLIAKLLTVKIGFELNDDDHDCERDSKKIVTIDIFKKWREFAKSANARIGRCHSEAKSIFNQAINTNYASATNTTQTQNSSSAITSGLGSMLSNLFNRK
jgi:hypothetical protein